MNLALHCALFIEAEYNHIMHTARGLAMDPLRINWIYRFVNAVGINLQINLIPYRWRLCKYLKELLWKYGSIIIF